MSKLASPARAVVDQTSFPLGRLVFVVRHHCIRNEYFLL